MEPTRLSQPAASAAAGSGGATQSATSAGGATQTVNQDLFLKLMVAQLRNQNPLNPVDGVDFLAQLSQVSTVEQLVAVRQQLEAIRKTLESGPAQGERS